MSIGSRRRTKTYEDAMRSIDCTLWKETIKSELDSIKSNHTWELVSLLRGVNQFVANGFSKEY